MKILVTGGAGFLGSNLCRRLINDGNEVWCVDNYMTGREENIKDLLTHPKFHEKTLNIRYTEVDYYTSRNGFPKKFDQIYDLACPASPPAYQADPIGTMLTSVVGAYNMLRIAQRDNAKILHTSTSEIYGDPKVHPQPESYHGNVNPTGIRACYDEGKRASETLCFDFHRLYNLDVRVVRIFNTYGPMMDPEDGRVVSNFIVQALRGKDLTVYGDGSQTRSFCYVDDMIEGLIRMMNNEQGFIGPVNLGNQGEFTVMELADKVLKMIGSKSKICFKPLPSDDPTVRRPDITVAKRELGWEPTVKLDDGLVPTIEYFRKQIGR